MMLLKFLQVCLFEKFCFAVMKCKEFINNEFHAKIAYSPGYLDLLFSLIGRSLLVSPRF